ncbi:amino acid adenylation domain-containing protein [Kitasatospora sp. NPDC006697]|uniref:non-ribosomal peptide synthetase n=1 Tax=Kitasatospora sp. NPDC006697 TaxID=3364020 RepID=UPI00368FB399
MDWVFLGIGAGHCVAQVVEGEGELTGNQLALAVERAAEASPGMRLVRRGKRWVDSGTAPVVTVLDGDGGDLLRRTALQRPLPASGPTCEVLLLPGERSTVVFRAFHGVTDGRGLLQWSADVFRALRGEPLLGADCPLNDAEFTAGLERPPAQAAPKLEWPPLLGARPRGSRGVLWRRRAVDGRHPAATAKLAAALARTRADGDARFFVPVDLRRHRPELRSTASLAWALQLPVGAGEDWPQVQQRLLALLAADAELAPQFADSILRTPLPVMRAANGVISYLASRKNRYNSLAYLSHLGTADLADFRAGEFHADAVYPLGTTGPGGPLEVNLLEHAGRTELTVAWHDGPGLAERAEAVLDTLEEALSPREHRQWAGNRTARPLPSDRSVVELFRAQVERTPDRTALSGPEGEVGYAELSRRADAVAAALRDRGVGAGDVVGILAGRTVAGIAALWGVLRAGAAYLPLDVRHPDARIRDLLADAGSTHCLVEKPYDLRLCEADACTPVVLDDLPAAEAWQDAAPAPDDLAYVIYTSGSTGRPKGVQIEHRNLANYVHWGLRAFGIDADTRLPLITSPSFDVTGTSVHLPLLTGGQVILMPEDPTHLSLRRLLAESGANALNLTPSHLDLIGQLDLAPTGYRTVLVIGEQLRTEVAARAQRMFGPACRIINEYGPTEATIGCTAHTFDPELDAATAVVPIGLPADNTTVHLLDPDGRFVAPGETGEMYLGGAQLARGYLGRPELDRERFVRLADGSRAYRTGDLARVLPSGELECVGRIDDQVKVRGHRVEPAEVARALEDHPAVERAVVVARSRPGQRSKALYGYALTTAPTTPEELTVHLGAVLPAYMVPAAVLLLDELPYTVSGKVDGKALPDPFGEPGAAGASAPLDPTEEAVAGIWARTLGADRARLEPQSDFHQLGGDSVSLLGMLAAVCRELLTPEQEPRFMAELPKLLAEPTVARVAALVRDTAARG